MNPGNYFYWDSVYRWVSAAGVEVVPDCLLTAAQLGNQRYYDQINDEFDIYVLTLTNSFRADFTKGLLRWAEMVNKLKIPVVGVGGGVQLGWDDGLEPGDAVDRGTKKLVSAILDRSAKISVRGEVTGAYLKRLGFGDEHVTVTGCPSLYLYGPDYEVKPKGPLTTNSKVGITIAVRDYGFAPFANRAFEQYPNIMYIGQTSGDLATFVWGQDRLVDAKPDIPVHLDHPYMREGKARMFLDARTWVDFLREYDYMLGTRIHGNVAALVGGTPATLISMDKRTHELGEFHDIPTIRRPDLREDDTVASVFERSDWTAFNKGLRPRYEAFCRFFDENGVPHIGQPGKANPAYDKALAKAVLPPPVEPIMTHGQIDPRALLDRLNWLREGVDETWICEAKGHFVPPLTPFELPKAPTYRDRRGRLKAAAPTTVSTNPLRRLAGKVLRRLGLIN
jgi:hypothetical protein